MKMSTVLSKTKQEKTCADKMDDTLVSPVPAKIAAIEIDTQAAGFQMASDLRTGALLRTLAAGKSGGRILELGTGTGLSACWLLDGMDAASCLVTVDSEPGYVEIAQKHLGHDERVEFNVQDGSAFLAARQGEAYDLIFADTWPGKYWDLDLALDLLKVGGFYLVDDMLPQDNWPADHSSKVAVLIELLENKPGYWMTKMDWSTGLILLAKT
jgi:predicted O-methyltransferase YrrM